MTEYIELKAVKEAVHRIMKPWPALEEDIYDLLDEIPSADVVEQKKGEWYDRGSLSCRCSNCGCKSTKEYSFCPNCGADMRSKERLKNMCNCWYCGGELIWQSDFNYSDVYGEGEGIVTYLTCSNCGAEVECSLRTDNEDD